MSPKFLIAVFVVILSVAGLIYSAVSDTAKAVVTVDELVASGSDRGPVQLGARVSKDSKIVSSSQPERTVKFDVEDISEAAETITVTYKGSMPDTLKPGRDVILQGYFKSGAFEATQLLTQCPSKYEPPVPGGKKAIAASY